MLGQLTGKAPTPIMYDPELTMKLSTIHIVDSKLNPFCLGVLLDHDRIAVPECYAQSLGSKFVCIHYVEGREHELKTGCQRLNNKIVPEEDRMYAGLGVVEIKVSSIAIEQCFELKRLPGANFGRQPEFDADATLAQT